MVRPVQAAVECVVTPDGGHNVWFVGDGAECAVIDPVGDLGDLFRRCELRRLRAVLWTSLSPESVRTGITLADRTGAETYVHADDLVIWQRAEPERRPQRHVTRGVALNIGGIRLVSIPTPGITPGALCWYAPKLSAVFTGQTLGADGLIDNWGADPTAADRSRLLASIRVGLFSLPWQTVVHPGSGPDTRIGTQRWDHRFWG